MEEFAPTPPKETVEAGTVLKGRYEILKTLGESYVARTYLAEDRNYNRHVVIKELSMKTLDDWKTLELFERESNVLSHLDHPRIPDWIDFFHERTSNETRVYLVQEYIQGESLKDQVQSAKHFTEAEVIQIGIDLCKILEYLHGFSPQIIHRDIKPGNVLVDREGNVHLIDFGAVRDKFMNREEGGTHTVVGTYGYMPFEQYQGRAVPASDIYSLAVTLVYLLSHKEPHELDDFGSRLRFEDSVNISKSLSRVLSKSLEPDWQKRYLTAKDLRNDLESVLAGRSLGSEQKIPSRKTVTAIAMVISIAMGVIGFWIATPKQSEPVRPVVAERTVTAEKAPATETASAVETAPVTKVAPQVEMGPVVAQGQILFEGRPVTDFTQTVPKFWLRNEDTGKVATADVSYENGTFEVRGLQPGTYGISTWVDRNPENANNYPGDLNAWTHFTVQKSGVTSIVVEVREIIHIKTPQDNGNLMERWGADYEEMIVHPSPLTFSWEGLGKDVYYDYSILRVKYPYEKHSSVTSGTTQDTNLRIDLPPNQKGEYYLFQISARRNGRDIGMLITHGARGYGWDYRFRVK